MDHYEILGVPRDASADEIRHAYLAKEQQLNDHRYDGAPPEVVEAVTQARAVVELANAVLSDPSRRSAYNKELDTTTPARGELATTAAAGGLAGEPMVPSAQAYMSPIADLLAPLEELASWLGQTHQSKTVPVPNVTGMKASDAFYAVAKADLHMKFVRLTQNPAGVDGICVDQDPPPGALARRHSTVTVQVWHPTAGNETAPL